MSGGDATSGSPDDELAHDHEGHGHAADAHDHGHGHAADAHDHGHGHGHAADAHDHGHGHAADAHDHGHGHAADAHHDLHGGVHGGAHAGAVDPASIVPPVEIAPGVLQIDTLLGGWNRMTAGYLVTGEAPVLVETGSQSSVPVLLAALAQLGLGPADLAGVAVTHIHLDHAGGVGDVARAFPSATVYVHAKGARHLADPTKLVSSAARVYGDLLDSLYGRLDPTPAERLHVLEDGEVLRVGPGRTLTAIDSPGHAKHHLGLHDSSSGILFAGDAVGVRLPDLGVLRPATPPPDFDLDQAVHSLHRFAERRPTGIALAHYGLLGDPLALLEEAESTLEAWAETATRAWRAGEDIATALEDRFGTETAGVAPEYREKLEILNGFHSNAAGFRRWLETRNGAGADPAAGAAEPAPGS